MKQFGIGQPVRRVEDRRFLTGRGHYLDDIVRPRQAHAVMLRSPHAHARIRAIDTKAASGPGVLAIFTGADLAGDGIGTIPCMSGVANRDKSAMRWPSSASTISTCADPRAPMAGLARRPGEGGVNKSLTAAMAPCVLRDAGVARSSG
jgi:CO/xanthine dehydrogenase Mo-binding subunit